MFLNNDVAATEAGWLEELSDTVEPSVLVGARIRSDGHAMVDGRVYPYIDGWCLAGLREDLLELGGFDTSLEEPAYYSRQPALPRGPRPRLHPREAHVGLLHLVGATAGTADQPDDRSSVQSQPTAIPGAGTRPGHERRSTHEQVSAHRRKVVVNGVDLSDHAFNVDTPRGETAGRRVRVQPERAPPSTCPGWRTRRSRCSSARTSPPARSTRPCSRCTRAGRCSRLRAARPAGRRRRRTRCSAAPRRCTSTTACRARSNATSRDDREVQAGAGQPVHLGHRPELSPAVPIVVEGLHELQAALAHADRQLRLGVRSGLRQVAEPVQRGAEELALREHQRGSGRAGRRCGSGSPATSSTSPRGSAAHGRGRAADAAARTSRPLLMDRAMQPALDQHAGRDRSQVRGAPRPDQRRLQPRRLI